MVCAFICRLCVMCMSTGLRVSALFGLCDLGSCLVWVSISLWLTMKRVTKMIEHRCELNIYCHTRQLSQHTVTVNLHLHAQKSRRLSLVYATLWRSDTQTCGHKEERH